jgi:pimeloyl-ACP methyl ester carboxylesterase
MMAAFSKTVLLIHGGLWEDIGADWFWRRTGVIDGLEQRGLAVLAPDRPRRPKSWAAESQQFAAEVAQATGERQLTAVGGSFGCSAAVRLALDFPDLVGRLVLAWPASAAHPSAQTILRNNLTRRDADEDTMAALLGPGTLPGVTDDELATLAWPVALVPSVTAGALHTRATVDALLRLLSSAVELPASPEAPSPRFSPYREAFLDEVADFLQV